MRNQTVLVLDFGGQYKELIASCIRGQKVYTEIRPCSISMEEVERIAPIGIVLTGGPKSVYGPGSPKCHPGIFSMGIPILGICYGMQLMCHMLGGMVVPAKNAGEYGKVKTHVDISSSLFEGLGDKITSLMSHSDRVEILPPGFKPLAKTASCKVAAFGNEEKGLYGVQFHPETKHTDDGALIIKNFLYRVCHAKGDYSIDDYINVAVRQIRETVKDQEILLALSGGVDSSVCAALIERAVPGKLTTVFVDHGLMRKNEGDEIESVFKNRQLNFVRINAKDRFLSALKGITDPEMKRMVIGREFIKIFEEQAAIFGGIPYLAQGTIYPDVIESGDGVASKIKSHHNVGGLPENIGFEGIIEPLRGLFKDEVRLLGKKLGLPDKLINRQPFPGPGLAVRALGEITEEKLSILREADSIVCQEIGKLKKQPDQYFAVLPGIRTVGVAGDERAYNYVVGVRAVMTTDFMTSEYARLPHRVLSRISSRISNEVKGAGRVVYDISGKPPATIEWE